MTVVSGLLAVYKAPGTRSSEVVRMVKKLLCQSNSLRTTSRTLKVGHGGTLDSFAEGILVIGVGSACKRLSAILSQPKKYIVTGQLGLETDTLDIEGNVIDNRPFEHIDRRDLDNVLVRFHGDIFQKPPVYSALKIAGKRASDRARQGEVVEMTERPVVVFKLDLLKFNPPFFQLEIHCSSGFYVRSLVRDVGRALGSCARANILCRTQNGPFSLPDPMIVRSDQLSSDHILASLSVI